MDLPEGFMVTVCPLQQPMTKLPKLFNPVQARLQARVGLDLMEGFQIGRLKRESQQVTSDDLLVCGESRHSRHSWDEDGW